MTADVTSYVNVSAPTTGTATAVPTLHAALTSALLLWTPYHGSTAYQGTRASYIIAVPAERTGAGPDWQLPGGPSETTGEAILEIRRRAGLTWEELADLFDVSRRSVHHWANGKAVTADHEQRIRRTLAVVRQLDLGDARRTRDALFTPAADGSLVFDLMRDGTFDEVLARNAAVGVRRWRPSTELSAKARHARRPAKPAELVEALNDRPVQSTAGEVTRVVRVSRTAS